MYRIIFLFVTVLSFNFLPAQTGWDEIKKMNGTYIKANSYSMNVEVKVYEKENIPTPEMNYTGNVKKSSGNYYVHMLGQTTVMTQQASIQIDEEHRKIHYRKQGKNAKPNLSYDPNTIISDSLKKNCTIKIVTQDASAIMLELISPKDPTIQKMIVVIDKTNYTLKKLEYFYKVNDDFTGEKVTINYTAIKVNEPIPDSVFAAASYVKKGSKGWEPADKWKGYEVIDYSKFDFGMKGN